MILKWLKIRVSLKLLNNWIGPVERLVSSEKGHGTPETLIKEAKHIAHNFLDLPCKEKDQDQLTPGAGYRGYKEFEKL
ncbi:hypothetical protein AB3S75_001967 [Citrus x aurantiifolia]